MVPLDTLKTGSWLGCALLLVRHVLMVLVQHVASITHGAVLMEPWNPHELVHTVLRRCSRLPIGHPGRCNPLLC